MASERLSVLLIEDSPGYTRLIYELLREAHSGEFNFESVETLAEGLARLARGGIDAVLLDLTLPDSRGQQTITQVRHFAPTIPTVVLTDINDEALAVQALKLGAQDYLLKSQVDGKWLARSIRYAIERKQVEEALRKSQEELRRLAEHLQTAREDERMALARELHDELGQQLTLAVFEVHKLARRVHGSLGDSIVATEVTQGLKQFAALLDDCIRSVRTMLTELRPALLDDFGIGAAVEWQVQQFQERTGIPCQLDVQLDNRICNRDISLAVFRILQEALTNVARHAQATQVSVRLSISAGQLALEVRDNGRGLMAADTAKAQRFGLLGMKERITPLGGALHIQGMPGQGTVVQVTVPLSPAQREAPA